MYTKDAIRFTLAASEEAVLASLKGIEDAPLTFPTANGGCHPLWIMGHLAIVEGLVYETLSGRENPAAAWGEMFSPGTVASPDASEYPALEVVKERYASLRAKNLALLDSMSEADLDKPTAHQPPGLEHLFDTYGKVLLTLGLHQMSHKAQLTDAARTAGRLGAVALPVAVAA